MKRLFGLLGLMIVISSTGCANRYESRCSKWLPWIYQNTATMDQEFAAYDISTQYEIYFCGMNYVRPPLVDLAFKVARNGPKAVGFLRAVLEQTNNDFEIVQVIEIFKAMQHTGSYDVASDEDLLRVLQKQVGRIRDDYWKSRATQDMEFIRRGAAK